MQSGIPLNWPPTAKGGGTELRETATELKLKNGKLRILVVDDDADACEILRQVLEHLGHDTECLEDSVDAMPRILREQFDVLLVDLVMPGLSGFDLLRAAGAADVPPRAVFAVSSYSEFRHKARDAGFDGFIDKPIEIGKLRPLLEQLLPSA